MQSTKLINDKDFLCFWLFHCFFDRTSDLWQKKHRENDGGVYMQQRAACWNRVLGCCSEDTASVRWAHALSNEQICSLNKLCYFYRSGVFLDLQMTSVTFLSGR